MRGECRDESLSLPFDFVFRFFGFIQRLATNVRLGYRKCPTGSHVIYFRDRGDWLEIVRVLHSAQDAERHL